MCIGQPSVDRPHWHFYRKAGEEREEQHGLQAAHDGEARDGKRLGPEAVVDPNTLVVAYLAADGYTRRYELDLLREIREKGIGKAVLSVAHAVPDEIKELSDYTIEYGPRADPVADDLVPPVYIMVGQLLGLFTSLRLGLRPDSPSASGIIHRVVEGVKVYDPQVYSRTGRSHVLAES